MSSELMIRLKEWGADPQEAVARMVDDREMYFRLLKRFYQNKEWERLKEAISQRNYKNAFQSAHDLKGNTSILSLYPLWEKISVVVEDLRGDEPVSGLIDDMEVFLKEIERFQEIISK